MSEQNSRDTFEQREDYSLQRHENPIKNRRREYQNQKYEAVLLQTFVHARHFIRQQISQDMRAVERRNRQHIENREVYVVDDYQIEDDERAFAQTDLEFHEHDENNQRGERRNQIRRGTGERNQNIIAARVAKAGILLARQSC